MDQMSRTIYNSSSVY